MQFRDFAENLLGSRIKIKLIRQLLKDESISSSSERELAQRIGVSHGAVNNILSGFYQANLIWPQRIGSAKVWQLNKRSYAYDFLINFHEKIKITPVEELKSDIVAFCLTKKEHIQKWEEKYQEKIIPQEGLPSIKQAIIFGSIAQGHESYDSDIDLFIRVFEDVDKKKAISYFTRLTRIFILKYGNRLSATILTDREAKKPENPSLLENIHKGVMVYQHENKKS